MTFLAELGLLGNTVGLMVMGVLFVGTLLAVHALYVSEDEFIGLIVPINVLFGAGFLFFATRFVKLVWEL